MSTVAIYDSGVGGLSIYQEVVQKCPQHDYVFVSDNAEFPYGTKATSELLKRVSSVADRIVNEFTPDLLILACNTASTVALPSLRSQHDIEIIGVVPAVKPAAALSRTRHIGLLATPATIKRDYTQKLIDDFAADCTIVRVGSTELVEMAEAKLIGIPVDKIKLGEILQPFLDDPQLDVLVLACTHFPLLREEIAELFECHSCTLEIIDSGSAIANRVAQLTGRNSGHKGSSSAFLTCQPSETAMMNTFTERGFKTARILAV